MQYSSAADAAGRMVLRKKSFKASPLVMGFASFKIVCIFIISDVSAKAALRAVSASISVCIRSVDGSGTAPRRLHSLAAASKRMISRS